MFRDKKFTISCNNNSDAIEEAISSYLIDVAYVDKVDSSTLIGIAEVNIDDPNDWTWLIEVITSTLKSSGIDDFTIRRKRDFGQ